jgi:ribose-phosphate pyrophosphokinase
LQAKAIAEVVGTENLVFVAPDAGALKRTARMIETFAGLGHPRPRLAMMEKHRSEDVVSGELFAGEVQDADVVIVDDMIGTGGTVLRTGRAATERGARRVFAAAPHGLFDNAPDELFDGRVLERIIVSDSVWPLGTLSADRAERLEVIPCGGLIAGAIGRLEGGGSIHRLLNPTP